MNSFNSFMAWLLRYSPMLGIFDWLFGGDDAAKAKTAYEFLTQNQDVLSYRDFFGYIWDHLVWWTIKGLYGLAETARGLVNDVFGIGNLLKDSGLGSMYTSLIEGVGMILLVISLVWIGIRMATSNRAPQISTVAIQTVVSVLLLIFGGTLINSLAQVSQNAFQDVAGTTAEESLPLDIISRNTLDLFKIASTKDGFKVADRSDWRKLNSFNKIGKPTAGKVSYHDLFLQTDMAFTLNPDDIDKISEHAKDDKTGDQLANLKYMIGTDEDGNQTAIPVPTDDGVPFFDVYKPGYARFTARRGTITMSLIGITIAYVFAAFTIAGAFVDLLFQRLYGVLVVATDLDSGQRTKQVVSDIFNSLLLIWFTGIEIRVFELILSAMGGLKLTGGVQIILILVSTFALFKGSQAASRYFGIDTGLKRGAGSLLAAVGAVGMAKRITGNAISGLGSIRGNKQDDTSSATEGTGDKEEGSRMPDGSTLPKPTVMDRARSAAGKIGGALGYAEGAGIGGMAQDAGQKVVDKAVGAKDAVVDKAKGAVAAVGSVGSSFSTAQAASRSDAFDRHGVQTPDVAAPTPSNPTDVDTKSESDDSALSSQPSRLAEDRPKTTMQPPVAPQNGTQPSPDKPATPATGDGATPSADQAPAPSGDKPQPTAPAEGQGPAPAAPAAPATPTTGTGETPSAAKPETKPTAATDPTAPQTAPAAAKPAATDAPLGDMGGTSGTSGGSNTQAAATSETQHVTAEKQRTVAVEENVKTTVQKTGTNEAPVNLGELGGNAGPVSVTGAASDTTSTKTVDGGTHTRSVKINQKPQVTTVQKGALNTHSVNVDVNSTGGSLGGSDDNG